MVAYTESPVTDPDQLGFISQNAAIVDSPANYAEEVIIDYANLKIALNVGATASPNNLTEDGATLKCIYSKLKDAWRTDTDLIKFPFPMTPITDEQFVLINGWNWDTTLTSGTAEANTQQLIRTGGWQVQNTTGDVTEEWAGVISLGDLVGETSDSTGQVYYDQLNDETTDNTVNFLLTDKVNQAVQIYRDDNGDGTPDFNYRSFFKMFIREWTKSYASVTFADVGVTTATFQAYRFPLTNSADIKVTYAENLANGTGLTITNASQDGTNHTYTVAETHGMSVGDIVTIAGMTDAGFNKTSEAIAAVTTNTFSIADTSTPSFSVGGTVTVDVFGNMSITYARDVDNERVLNTDAGDNTGYVRGVWQTGTAYNVGDVVRENGSPEDQEEWYIATSAATSAGSSVATDNTSPSPDWVLYDFDFEFTPPDGNNLYAFTVSIDADVSAGGSPAVAYNNGSATTTQIYNYIQSQLRLASDIDGASPGVVIGKTADALLGFVGDQLNTERGVFVSSLRAADVNAVDFYDYSDTLRQYAFTAILTVSFGQNLQDDEQAKFWIFFTNDDAGNDAGADFGTNSAIIVNDSGGTAQEALFTNTNIGGSPYTKRPSVDVSYDYDGNVQRGAASAAKDAPITAVAIGLSTGQYVSATGTIARSKANSISLVAPLERNYTQGSTFP
jgi:hypothetical protein